MRDAQGVRVLMTYGLMTVGSIWLFATPSFEPQSDVHLSQRLVNVRRLTSIVVMGMASSALMLGALYTAFGRNAHFASSPTTLQRAAAHDEIVGHIRGDRLDRSQHPTHAVSSKVRIEQLDGLGRSIRPYTHVVGRLGQLASLSSSTMALPDRDGDKDKTNTMSALPRPEVSPFEGLFKNSQPKLPENVSAYASSTEPEAVTPPLGEPVNVTVIPRGPLAEPWKEREIVAAHGDTLAKILLALGVKENDVRTISSLFAVSGWFGDKVFAGGEKITVVEKTSEEDSSSSRPLKVILERKNVPDAAVALSDSGQYLRVPAGETNVDQKHSRESEVDETEMPLSSGVHLQASLYMLAQAYRINRELIDELVRLCAHDVDVETPVSKSDLIDFLYSTDGSGQPELVFVALKIKGHVYRYYHFTAPDDDSADFYDSAGRSVTKFLLRKPVAGGRLGDGFGWRIHPVLRDRRFHEGVDYAAPFGSPIVAAGAGVVEKIDQQSGYGKYVRILHDFGYETTYAHVSGFPRSLKIGDRVVQGQKIAYVGSTGLSTGPHLYYELRINGHNVDPLRVRIGAGRVLSEAALETFRRMRERTDQLLDASNDDR